MKKTTEKITWKNVIAYIQGNLRYKLYYSQFKWLIRKHIREQIDFRVRAMKPECYNEGACVKCGCVTTALQMANKSCKGLCYPIMMNKKQWKEFIGEKGRFMDDSGTWVYAPIQDRIFRTTPDGYLKTIKLTDK